MLVTLDKFRSPISSLFFEDGTSCWLSCEFSLQQAWFLVQLQEFEGLDALEYSCERTVLLFDFRSIRDLLEKGKQSTLRVKAIHLVTPSHMNGTDSWRMERVRKVISGHQTVAGEEFPVEVLETTEGVKYDSFSGLAFKGKLIGAKLRFDLSTPTDRKTERPKDRSLTLDDHH
jgi:hypothetical protein